MRTRNTSMSGSRLSLIAVSGLMIGLTACGGGGSGGGSPAPAAVTISSTNASQVAGASVDTITGSGGLVTMGVQTSVSAPVPSVVSAVQSAAKIGEAAVQAVIAQGAAPAIVTGAVVTTYCAVSGSYSTTSASATSGTITYNNCVQVAGMTLNGTISISNIVSTASSLSADEVYNLSLTTSSPYLANTLTIRGDIHVSDNLTTGAVTISGTSLSITNTDATLGNFSLRNYSITTDSIGHTTAMTFAFTVNGETATFAMTTPFVNTGGLFPSSGAATITGAGSTVLKFTVLGDERAVGNQVMLELSTNGGTTYAAPVYVTWASISSLI